MHLSFRQFRAPRGVPEVSPAEPAQPAKLAKLYFFTNEPSQLMETKRTQAFLPNPDTPPLPPVYPPFAPFFTPFSTPLEPTDTPASRHRLMDAVVNGCVSRSAIYQAERSR